MTDLEQRLRAALEAAAPDGAEPSGLASGARAQAHRNHRRAVAGMATAVVAAVAVGLGTSWATRERVTTLPATTPSSSPTDAASLCDREAGPYRGLVEPLGEDRVLAVLCAADPQAAAWAGFPASPMALEGDPLNLFIPDLGGPPDEECSATREFADFRVIMLHPDESVEEVSDDGRCDGRYIVQSFYSAYAADLHEVVACVHGAWAPIEVADLPRFHPVTAPTVPADDVTPLLGGLDRANVTVGPLDDCPWRGAVVTLRLRTDAGPDVVLQCDTLSGRGNAVRWLALGPRAEAAVRSLIDAGRR